MLRRLRVQRGWSQEAVALRAGIHPSYLSQVESGTRTPSVLVLERLLVVLGASDKQRSAILREVSKSGAE